MYGWQIENCVLYIVTTTICRVSTTNLQKGQLK